MPIDLPNNPGPLSDHGPHEPADAVIMRELSEKARRVSREIVDRVNRVRVEDSDKTRPPAPLD